MLFFQLNFFLQFKNKEIPSVGSGNCMVVFISDTDGQFVCEMSSAVGSLSFLPLLTFPPTLPRSLLYIAIFRWSLVSNSSPTVESIAVESNPHFLFPARFHFSVLLWSDDKKQKQLFCVLFRAYICLKRCMKFDFWLFQNFYFFNFVLKFVWQHAFKHFGIWCIHCLAAVWRLNQNRFLA